MFVSLWEGADDVPVEGNEGLEVMERHSQKVLGQNKFSIALTPPVAF